MSGSCWQVLLVIIRKLYGFDKKEDWIEYSQMSKMCGLSKSRISESIKLLRNHGIVTQTRNGIKQCIGINKNFHVVPQIRNSTGFQCKPFRESGSLLQKKLYKIKKNYSPNSDEYQTSELLFSLIQQRDPRAKSPDYQKWAVHVDRLIRLDKRSPEQIKVVVNWCQNDDFWKNNILSTEKLRKQFTQLVLKMPQQEQSRWFK